jgi:ribonuclease P protein component
MTPVPRHTSVRRPLVTLRSPREIDDLFKRGARSGDGLLTVFVADSAAPERAGRLAFIAGRKVGNAVARNRCKRVLREAVRRAGAPWDGLDVVVVARRAVAGASVDRIDQSLLSHLRRLGVSV